MFQKWKCSIIYLQNLVVHTFPQLSRPILEKDTQTGIPHMRISSATRDSKNSRLWLYGKIKTKQQQKSLFILHIQGGRNLIACNCWSKAPSEPHMEKQWIVSTPNKIPLKKLVWNDYSMLTSILSLQSTWRSVQVRSWTLYRTAPKH